MTPETSATRPVALRTALIWRDEVMSDIVADVPKKITIGHKGKSTFVVPDVGLPSGFAVITPGNRGYLLTLGEKMRGTVCIDGKEQDVRDAGDASGPGGFRATPIGGRDWGVVDLDESGDYKLFFQFVPVETALDNHADLFSMITIALGMALLFLVGITGAGGLISALLRGSTTDALFGLVSLTACTFAAAFLMAEPGSAVRHHLKHVGLGLGGLAVLVGIQWVQAQLEWSFLEWVTRGTLVIIGGVPLFGLGWSLAFSDPEQQASTGFSIILHGALIDRHDRALRSVGRSERVARPARADRQLSRVAHRARGQAARGQADALAQGQQGRGRGEEREQERAQDGDQEREGASGGKGDTERARHKDAKENEKPDPPKVAFFEDKNKAMIDNILDRSMNVGAFKGIQGETKKGSLGFGNSEGTGVGEGKGTGTTRGSKGKGTGGGGNVEGDFVTNKGKVDMGKDRPGGTCTGPNCKGAGPKEVAVSVGEMSGDPGGYTEDEINRVVKRSAGMFRACYQKELNRSPGIGGKIVVRFKIGGDGAVLTAAPAGGTTLANEAVKECVARNVNRLKFPPKGGVANVTYPFLFSPGG